MESEVEHRVDVHTRLHVTCCVSSSIHLSSVFGAYKFSFVAGSRRYSLTVKNFSPSAVWVTQFSCTRCAKNIVNVHTRPTKNTVNIKLHAEVLNRCRMIRRTTMELVVSLIHLLAYPPHVPLCAHRRFVGEFGGHGNMAAVRVAMHAALWRRGVDPLKVDPWYFPTPHEYRKLLEAVSTFVYVLSCSRKATFVRPPSLLALFTFYWSAKDGRFSIPSSTG